MIEPKVSDGKVVFGPCRLSYTYLFQKYSRNNNDKGKFQTNVLIPKSEKKTVAAIQQAIEYAKKAGVDAKWGGKEPKKLCMPLKDGDLDKDDEVYEGMYYVNARSTGRPGIVDARKNIITDEEDVYSGMWAIVSVIFFPYDESGNKGVACGLNNVMKTKDDAHLGGRVPAQSEFRDINYGDDDDDDL